MTQECFTILLVGTQLIYGQWRQMMTSFRQVKFFLHTSPELCPSKVASCRNCLLQGGCGDRQALILLAERTNKKNGFHFLQTVWRLLKTPNIWPPSFHYWSHSKSAKTRGVFGMVTREIQSPLSRIIAHDAVQSDLVLSTVELDFLHLQLEYLPLLHK